MMWNSTVSSWNTRKILKLEARIGDSTREAQLHAFKYFYRDNSGGSATNIEEKIPRIKITAYGSKTFIEGDFTLTNANNKRILTSTVSTGLNCESGLTYDGSTLNVTGDLTISGRITGPNKVLEYLSSFADGTQITTQREENFVFPDVTSSQTLPYGSYTDATGTEIDYRPPPGTNRVEYSLTFTYDHHSSTDALFTYAICIKENSTGSYYRAILNTISTLWHDDTSTNQTVNTATIHCVIEIVSGWSSDGMISDLRNGKIYFNGDYNSINLKLRVKERFGRGTD